MSTIQPNLTPAQARARELVAGLPQDADAEGRIAAAQSAVDRLESEFPGSPEAATLKMVKAMASGTSQGVTRETLLNAGLDLCRKGAVAGSPYLAGAALELADHGWDDQDKRKLLGIGYDHLRRDGVLPQPGTVLKLAEKYGDLRHRRSLLEDTVAGAQDPQGLAGQLVRHRKNPKWLDLAEGLLQHLAQSGPPELRGSYALAETMVGSWFKKLGGEAQQQILDAFLAAPIRTPAEAPERAGRAAAVVTDRYYGNSDLLKAGHRALDALEAGASPADRITIGLARKVQGSLGERQTSAGQRIVGAALQRLGASAEVSGPSLAGTVRALVEAGRFENQANYVLTTACSGAAENAPDGRWRAAFRDLGRLIPHLEPDYYYSKAPVLAFMRAMDELQNLSPGQDPVEAMVRGVSGVADGGDPAGVIGDFLNGKDTGALKNTGIVRELLAVLAEDAATPQMRATARFVHRAMEGGNLQEGIKSMKDAFEIQRMAQASENPNAVKISDDQVQIGGVVIRRKTDG